MLATFLRLAMKAPARQAAFRRAAGFHALFVAGVCWAVFASSKDSASEVMGYALLGAGIVEGAALLGWRLTQLPKSQALEFLLASPVRPWVLFAAEASTGLGRLIWVQLAGLPPVESNRST